MKDLTQMKDSVTFVNTEGKKFTLHRKEEMTDGKSAEETPVPKLPMQQGE
jgi:hypothetical protein